MKTITVTKGLVPQKIETFLKKNEQLPLSLIFRLLRHRQIRINGQRARQGMYIQTGDHITLPGITETTTAVGDGPLIPTGFRKKHWKILYEDAHIIAINKEPDIAVHPAHNIPYPKTLLAIADEYARDHNHRIFMVHRLDRYTSGVMLFAKTAEAREKLQNLFAHRAIEKIYLALVQGKIGAKGVIDKPVSSKWDASSKNPATMLPAVTHYERLQIIRVPFAPHYVSLIAAEPKTGKLHQIRRHCKMIGHPIIGDVRYGNANINRSFRKLFKITRHFLHAARITFRHPITGVKCDIEAPLSKDLLAVVAQLSRRVQHESTLKPAKHKRRRAP